MNNILPSVEAVWNKYRVALDFAKTQISVLVESEEGNSWQAEFTEADVAELTAQAQLPQTFPAFAELLRQAAEQSPHSTSQWELCTYSELLDKLARGEDEAQSGSSALNSDKRFLLLYTSKEFDRALYILPLPPAGPSAALSAASPVVGDVATSSSMPYTTNALDDTPTAALESELTMLRAENHRLRAAAAELEVVRQQHSQSLRDLQELRVKYSELDRLSKLQIQAMKKDCEELISGLKRGVVGDPIAQIRALKDKLRAEREYNAELRSRSRSRSAHSTTCRGRPEGY
eukprot:RCo045391